MRAAPSASTYQSYTVDADLDYSLDLWGKVRNAVQAGRDLVQANTDNLASVRLSLQASLANAYFTLRGLDTERQLFDQTISTYQRAVALTRSRHAGGIASGLEVTRAETQLDTARAQAADLDAQRARAEHAIASLMGGPRPPLRWRQRSRSRTCRPFRPDCPSRCWNAGRTSPRPRTHKSEWPGPHTSWTLRSDSTAGS